MNILFIGGTKFVGRNLVEFAAQKNHEIHILQRGHTNQDLFLNCQKYYGDRIQIENILPNDVYFDLVIDCCGYHPNVVNKSVQFLKRKTKKYIFISSASVYSDFSKPGNNENMKIPFLDSVPEPSINTPRELYGPLKHECEKSITDNFPSEQYLILRPCIIVGKYDDTNRFNYWISQIMNSDILEVPDDKNAFIQFIDIRSICDFIFKDESKSGVFNLIGPNPPIKFIDFIIQAKDLLNPKLKLNFISPEMAKVPFYNFNSSWDGFFKIDGSKALSQGLKSFSAAETIQYVASC